MVVAIASLLVTLAAVTYALCCGGWAERRGAMILAIMLATNALGHAFIPLIYMTVDPVGLAVDVTGLVGFSWLGLVSRRLWPLWASSLQLLSTGAHFVRALHLPVRAPVYYWMKSLPTVAVVLLLIFGTWAYANRERKNKQRS